MHRAEISGEKGSGSARFSCPCPRPEFDTLMTPLTSLMRTGVIKE